MARSSSRRTDAELCLITLCDPTLDDTPAGLNARLSRLEQGGVIAAPAAPATASSVRPAQSTDGPPPWEVPAPPTKQQAPNPAAPEKADPAAFPPPVHVEAPAPVSSGWPGWAALRDALRSEIEMGDYIFLSNPDMVEGRLEGNTLFLWAGNDFIKGMIGKKSVLDKVAQSAARLAGTPIQVEVLVGSGTARGGLPFRAV